MNQPDSAMGWKGDYAANVNLFMPPIIMENHNKYYYNCIKYCYIIFKWIFYLTFKIKCGIYNLSI